MMLTSRLRKTAAWRPPGVEIRWRQAQKTRDDEMWLSGRGQARMGTRRESAIQVKQPCQSKLVRQT